LDFSLLLKVREQRKTLLDLLRNIGLVDPRRRHRQPATTTDEPVADADRDLPPIPRLNPEREVTAATDPSESTDLLGPADPSADLSSMGDAAAGPASATSAADRSVGDGTLRSPPADAASTKRVSGDVRNGNAAAAAKATTVGGEPEGRGVHKNEGHIGGGGSGGFGGSGSHGGGNDEDDDDFLLGGQDANRHRNNCEQPPRAHYFDLKFIYLA
jgi:hypothetical protein